jgi:hypothetical protein
LAQRQRPKNRPLRTQDQPRCGGQEALRQPENDEKKMKAAMPAERKENLKAARLGKQQASEQSGRAMQQRSEPSLLSQY